MSDFFGKKLNRWLIIYWFLMATYTVFSYSLTAPNLVLTSWTPYWKFQTWMWSNLFNHRQLLTTVYLIIMSALFVTYLNIIKIWPKKKQLIWWLPLLLASPLVFSNNALSHDVFNYIFNAKMVVVYHANPHLQTALNFTRDNWTRFMHNTHTPAPYFYGWTGLSLLPYILGGGKFTFTWFVFRLFSFLSLGLLSFFMIQFGQLKSAKWQLLTILNPLLLIEVISNAHNDLWMMAPALAAMILISSKHQSFTKKLISFILILVSAAIKMATLALLPLWLALVLPWKKIWPQWWQFVTKNWALLSSVLLFLPLLTPRSKQFLPWYLIWSLVWLPLIDKKWQTWKISLLVLSISSMLRYLPYLWIGNYDGNVIWHQQLITWIPFIMFWLINFSHRKLASKDS